MWNDPWMNSNGWMRRMVALSWWNSEEGPIGRKICNERIVQG